MTPPHAFLCLGALGLVSAATISSHSSTIEDLPEGGDVTRLDHETKSEQRQDYFTLGTFTEQHETSRTAMKPKIREPRRAGRSKSRGEKSFKRQVKLLKKLKCKPRPVKVSVGEFLNQTDEILNYPTYPESIVIRKCLRECSFCGNRLGQENMACVAVDQKEVSVFLRYHTIPENPRYQGQRDINYHRIKVTMDTKCDCR